MRSVLSVDLLAIDPGIRMTGWAYFDAGELQCAGAVRGSDMLDRPGYPIRFTNRVVIEVPRWYPKEHKIDVNDLIDLSVLVGEMKHLWSVAKVELVYPRTWKGTVPKAIHNKRVLAALTDEERALLPRRPRAKDFDNNMVDAVGIGLWKLGRM